MYFMFIYLVYTVCTFYCCSNVFYSFVVNSKCVDLNTYPKMNKHQVQHTFFKKSQNKMNKSLKTHFQRINHIPNVAKPTMS